MTDEINDSRFTYHKQCKTCNMGSKVHDLIEAGLKNQLGFAEISRHIGENMNITISPDAVGNHIKKHLTNQALLGVVLPPTDKMNTPKGYEEGMDVDRETGEGTITTPPQTSDLISDFTDILLEMGLNPETFDVIGTARVSKWNQRSWNSEQEEFEKVWLTAYKLNIQMKMGAASDEAAEKSEEESLPTMYTRIIELAEKPATMDEHPSKRKDRTTVVVFADPQVGKSGSRGGTEELLGRIGTRLVGLEEYSKTQNSADAVFLDAGDIIEGFENVAQQMFTNDLSLMQQVDVAHSIELEFIDLLSRTHDTVTAASVPSNHAAWRKGKDILGRPSDDWGLHILQQVQKGYDRYIPDHNVSFQYPDTWKKSLVMDVQGLGLGLVHGDDVGSLDKIPQWWANQCHGGGPVATADILISGHYHTTRIQPTGRNPYNGKQKWWIGAPTLDNGSDWFANGMGGGDSDPGLIVFVVDKEKGLDFQSITIL